MKSIVVDRFDVMRLHHRSDRAWAVTAIPGGWIATDKSGALLMRLPEREARDLAAAMTEALEDQIPRVEPLWPVYDRA